MATDQLTERRARERFILRSGEVILHREPPTKDCGVENRTGVINLDAYTAGSMLAKGEVQGCPHCKPNPMNVAAGQPAETQGLRIHEH